MGLLAWRAGAASRSLGQRVDDMVLRSSPSQAGTVEVVRVSSADLLAQKHSLEVLSVQVVNVDGSMVSRAALWRVVSLFIWFIWLGLGFLRRI